MPSSSKSAPTCVICTCSIRCNGAPKHGLSSLENKPKQPQENPRAHPRTYCLNLQNCARNGTKPARKATKAHPPKNPVFSPKTTLKNPPLSAPATNHQPKTPIRETQSTASMRYRSVQSPSKTETNSTQTRPNRAFLRDTCEELLKCAFKSVILLESAKSCTKRRALPPIASIYLSAAAPPMISVSSVVI